MLWLLTLGAVFLLVYVTSEVGWVLNRRIASAYRYVIKRIASSIRSGN